MYIIGASGHAKIIIDILEELEIPIEGIWDDDPKKKHILGYTITGKILDFLDYQDNNCLLAIGNNLIRKELAEKFFGANFVSVCHPKSNISKHISIGKGTVVNSGATINAGVSIGSQVIVNTNSSIDHDCIIEDFVHISPNAALAGNVTIMEGAHVGIGATIIQGVTIGKWAIIGAGSVVISNVPDFGVVVGVPGKIIKYNKHTV